MDTAPPESKMTDKDNDVRKKDEDKKQDEIMGVGKQTAHNTPVQGATNATQLNNPPPLPQATPYSESIYKYVEESDQEQGTE